MEVERWAPPRAASPSRAFWRVGLGAGARPQPCARGAPAGRGAAPPQSPAPGCPAAPRGSGSEARGGARGAGVRSVSAPAPSRAPRSARRERGRPELVGAARAVRPAAPEQQPPLRPGPAPRSPPALRGREGLRTEPPPRRGRAAGGLRRAGRSACFPPRAQPVPALARRPSPEPLLWVLPR